MKRNNFNIVGFLSAENVQNTRQVNFILFSEHKKILKSFKAAEIELSSTLFLPGDLTKVSISLYINRISAVDENKEVN